jgi:hypothetical protein
MLERELMNMYGTQYVFFMGWIFQFTQLYSCVFIASQVSKNEVFRFKQIIPKYAILMVL